LAGRGGYAAEPNSATSISSARLDAIPASYEAVLANVADLGTRPRCGKQSFGQFNAEITQRHREARERRLQVPPEVLHESR
jgi:hypothetical protein